jgi:hypothetical protein
MSCFAQEVHWHTGCWKDDQNRNNVNIQGLAISLPVMSDGDLRR